MVWDEIDEIGRVAELLSGCRLLNYPLLDEIRKDALTSGNDFAKYSH